MIELALHLTKHGYSVFPLAPGGKVPAISKENGGRGCLDATRNTQQIERWWSEYPEANPGIATGGTLLVIDIDPRKAPGWLDSLNSLKLPQTFTVRTWSGGWHIYLSMRPDTRITIGANLLPGIDWRCNGGYVVGPGSRVNGALYTIARNGDIALAPESLLERLRERRKKARPVPDATGHMVIPDGQRNETLFALACQQRRFGIEFNAILQALRAANADHCQPPLPDEELRQIAASAMNYKHPPRESA